MKRQIGSKGRDQISTSGWGRRLQELTWKRRKTVKDTRVVRSSVPDKLISLSLSIFLFLSFLFCYLPLLLFIILSACSCWWCNTLCVCLLKTTKRKNEKKVHVCQFLSPSGAWARRSAWNIHWHEEGKKWDVIEIEREDFRKRNAERGWHRFLDWRRMNEIHIWWYHIENDTIHPQFAIF